MRVINIKLRITPYSKRLFLIISVSILVIAIPIITFFMYNYLGRDKIAPGIAIAGIDVGGLTNNQALQKIETNINAPKNINLLIDDQSFKIPAQEIDLKYDYQAAVNNAYSIYRPNIVKDILTSFNQNKTMYNLPIPYQVNKDNLNQYTSVIAGLVSIEPIYPAIGLEDQKITIEKGSPGKDITSDALNRLVDENLKYAKPETIKASTKYIDPTINDSEIQMAQVTGEKLATKSAIIKSDDQEYKIEKNDLLKLVDPKNGYYDTEFNALISAVDDTFNRDPVNAVFNFKDGKVVEFAAAKTGIEVKNDDLKSQLKSTINNLENSDIVDGTIELPANVTQPKITTQEVNNLGIKELIGKGESDFHHSISSRIYNVALAASKFNGVLIPPNTVFSFNDALGDVSAYTGYKQAYVIRDGKTVLGDGGGVCQVSTTMFRAVLDSGLPVVERHAHSYRVSYYEEGYPVGIDATVYSPTTDFKFKNDTPGYILVQTKTDTTNMHLTFEFYGTSDGRISTITKPVITSVSPPPEDLYIDDPTLPAGKVQQIDWKAWGAKVYFNYKVTRSGETIENETFHSNYQPWQAKFLRGTGPA